MIGVLLLVLPAFLHSNSKLKQFLTNLTIWIIVVLIILTIIYIFKKLRKNQIRKTPIKVIRRLGYLELKQIVNSSSFC